MKEMTVGQALQELQALFEIQKGRIVQWQELSKTEVVSAAGMTADVNLAREILSDYIDFRNQADALNNLNRVTGDLQRMMGGDHDAPSGFGGEEGNDTLEQLLGSLRKGFKPQKD